MFKIGNFYYPDGGGAFWENLFVAVIGAFVGFGGALLIFWIGIRKNRKEDQHKADIYLINRLEFLCLLLEGVLKNSKLQIENYIKQAKEINRNPYKICPVSILASNQIPRLQAIDSQDLYIGFRYLFEDTAKVRDLYNQFFYQIDFLEKSLDQLMQASINNIKGIAIDQETMRVSVNRLYSDFPRYFKDQKLKPLLLEQLVEFNSYIGTGELDIKKFHEKFLIPLFLKVSKIETEDQENQNNLLGSIRSVTTIIEHFKDNNKDYADTDALVVKKDLAECLEKLTGYHSDIKYKLMQIQPN